MHSYHLYCVSVLDGLVPRRHDRVVVDDVHVQPWDVVVNVGLAPGRRLERESLYERCGKEVGLCTAQDLSHAPPLPDAKVDDALVGDKLAVGVKEAVGLERLGVGEELGVVVNGA
jgi:hypothetical protein